MHLIFLLAVLLLFPTYSGMDIVDLSEDGDLSQIEMPIDLAHSKNLSHRGTWIYVMDHDMMHMAFFHRSKSHVTCSDTWNILGEHTKVGESYRIAALRGLSEELNLIPSDLKLFETLSPPERLHLTYPKVNRSDTQWTETFIAVLGANRSIKFNEDETSGIQWIKLPMARKWISHCKKRRCRGIEVYSIYTHI